VPAAEAMVFILTGEVHSGKTSLLKKVIPLLQARRRVTGYVCESVGEGDSIKGYDLVEIGGGRFPFLRRGNPPDRQNVGPFFLEEEGMRQAERILGQASPGSLLIVDEIGPLELEGGGVRAALEKALSRKTGPVLVVIRQPLLDDLMASLGLQSATVVRADSPDAARRLAGVLGEDPA